MMVRHDRKSSALVFIVISMLLMTGAAADLKDSRARLAELQSQARFDDALVLANEILLEIRGSTGTADPQYGRALNSVAEVYRRQGALGEAESRYLDVLRSFARTDRGHRDVIRTALGSLTLIYMSQGRFADAEHVAQQMRREVKSTPVTAKTSRPRTGKAPSARIRPATRSAAVAVQPKPVDPPPRATELNGPNARTNRGADAAARPEIPSQTNPQAVAIGNVGDAINAPTRTGTGLPTIEDVSRQSRQRAVANLNRGAGGRSCNAADVMTHPRADGMTLVRMISICRAGQAFQILYGDQVTEGFLAHDGQAELLLDLFLGNKGPYARAELRFSDRAIQYFSLGGSDLSGVTKISISWDAPVDLDLHAKEYAAARGSDGHVWGGRRLTFDEAQKKLNTNKRGHGFLSSS
ncbi:MAG: tetratricopeptide repeat protein, partial [Hyphomicrobiaceae bacterium]